MKAINYIGQEIAHEKSATAEQSVTLRAWGEKIADLSASPYKGKATWVLNGIAKELWQRGGESIEGMPEAFRTDHLISSHIEFDGTTAWVVRGVKGKDVGLLMNLQPKVYEGYPLEIAVVYHKDRSVASYSALQMSIGGVYSEYSGNDIVAVVDGHSVDGIGYAVRYTDGSTEQKLWSASDNVGVVPTHPFYIRFVNYMGGWTYWMMVCHQERTTKLDSISTHELKSGEVVTMAHEVSESVKVSTGSINTIEFNGLVYLVASPLVQWWNEDAQEWVDVTLKKGSKVEWASDQNVGEIIMEFMLPTKEAVL